MPHPTDPARPAPSTPRPRPRSAWLAGAGLALLLGMGACIKRQPLPEAPVTPTPTTPAAMAAETSDEAGPTGNWGKVPGVPVIGPGGIAEFSLQGQTSRVKLSKVQVEGEDFTEALRAVVLQGSENPWDVQIQTKSVAPVEKGDVLLATFTFRVTRTSGGGGDGETEFVFELGRDPWTKSASYAVRAGNDWTTIRVPFEASSSYAPGEAQANFRLGYAPQTIEIAAVTVENFGKQLVLADLPTTSPTYRGMRDNAPWRAAAEQRIEAHRKAELTVLVKDANGRRVPSANVRVTLRRHAFGFGTLTSAARLLDDSDPKYLETLCELFSSVTLENDLEWRALAGEYGAEYTAERTRAALSLLAERGLPVHGGALVRPAWDAVPSALRQTTEPAALRQAVAAHVKTTVGAHAGQLASWSVVDSPYDRRDLLELLGESVMTSWFELARAADPKAKLLLETAGALNVGPLADRQRAHAESTLKQLLAAGAPIDALGVQAPYAAKLTAPEDVIETLARLGKLGKPIVVTRFDPMLDDEALTASYLRDFYLAVFSSPAAQGLTLWGFWDREHWRSRAALFHHDWTPKPAAAAYRNLIGERWHTDETGQTNATGSLTTRGFLGEYLVEAQLGEQSAQGTATLTADGGTVELTLAKTTASP